MSKIKLVIFDMDGTILDTLQDLTDSINHVLSIHNYPVRTMEEVRNFVGNGIEKLVERAVPKGISKDEISKIYNEMIEYYPQNCDIKTKPYDGIIDLLKKLKEEGIYIAVNSNKDDLAVKFLAKKYYGDLIDYCVGTIKGVPKKPAPNGIINIMQHFNIGKNNAVYVGDSDVDVQTALNSNLNAIIVEWGFRKRDFLEEYIYKICQQNKEYTGKMQIVSTCEDVINVIFEHK